MHRRLITYACLLSLFFSFKLPMPLHAQCENDQWRDQAAVAVAGVTLLGLVVGVGVIALGTHGKHCHSCYSHDSSYSYWWSSSYSCESSDSYWYSSPSYSYSGSQSSYSEWSDYSDFYYEGSIASITERTLSGEFIANSHLDLVGQGSVIPLIQLPDGTVSTLDPISFIEGESSIPFGPFNQKGIYRFGIRVEPGMILPEDAQIGFVTINVDGEMVESADLTLPADPRANFVSPATSYELRDLEQ